VCHIQYPNTLQSFFHDYPLLNVVTML